MVHTVGGLTILVRRDHCPFWPSSGLYPKIVKITSFYIKDRRSHCTSLKWHEVLLRVLSDTAALNRTRNLDSITFFFFTDFPTWLTEEGTKGKKETFEEEKLSFPWRPQDTHLLSEKETTEEPLEKNIESMCRKWTSYYYRHKKVVLFTFNLVNTSILTCFLSKFECRWSPNN